MSESKTSYWHHIVIALLAFGVLSLIGIEKELKAQRTPEQIAAMNAQEKRENEAEQRRDEARKQRIAHYKSTPWSDITGEDYLHKFLAHKYHVILFILAIVAHGPVLYERLQRRG